MTRQQSEGEVHVEAMRLILAEMERREDVPDWTIWQHMLNMLETIFQGIENQRDDDRDELMHTRKDRDHWKQARQDAIEAGELMKAEIETLRTQLANAQRELSEQSMVVNVQTQQDAAAWQQQVDSANAEVSYLRARLDEERSVIAGLRQQLRTAAGRVDLTEETNRSLRQQLDAARETILAQKAGNQYLRLLIDKVRAIAGRDDAMSERLEQISQALDEFDDGTIEPTPVAEPARCPEVERLQVFEGKVRMPDCYREVIKALAELDAGTEPTPVAETVDAEGGA